MKKFKAMIAIFTAVMLSGCYPSEPTGKTASQDPNDFNVENSINSQAENFTLSAELPTDISSEIPSIKLTLRNWDKAFMENLFLEGKTVVETSERDCDFYPNESFYSYDTDDQIHVYFEPGRFCFDDKAALDGEFKYGSVYLNRQPNYMSSVEGLTAFSSENAVERVNEFLDKLGITNYGEPIISPITAEFANEELASQKKFSQRIGETYEYTPWTEENEIYSLHYPLVYENTELADEGLPILKREWAVNGSFIDAAVSKDKIITVRGYDIYSENYEISAQIPVNYNPRKASEKLKNFYSNLVLEKPVEFYKCKLTYIPDDVTEDKMTVTFVPVWEFTGESDRRQLEQFFYVDSGIRFTEA